MSINSDLASEIEDIFDGDYQISVANDIPAVDAIGLGKDGKQLELAMLFVDIHESTKMVDGFRRQTAAKMYKAFLRGVVRLVNGKNGQVASFNGDGVLAAFAGSRKCNNAVEAALGLSYFIEYQLRPVMEDYFARNGELNDMVFDYGLGIDVGDVLIVRGGIRGVENNDLVWVGNATNISVKLADLGTWPFNIRISKEVFGRLDKGNKTSSDGRAMWETRTWTAQGGTTIYRSNWLHEY